MITVHLLGLFEIKDCYSAHKSTWMHTPLCQINVYKVYVPRLSYPHSNLPLNFLRIRCHDSASLNRKSCSFCSIFKEPFCFLLYSSLIEYYQYEH
jgi:hypothetical protein